MAKQSRIVLIGLIGLLGIVSLVGISALARRSGDTDEALFPDPLVRTQHRLQVLSMAIDDFQRQHGRYPASLREVSSSTRRYDREVYRFDAWMHPIDYRLQGERYELTSAGPDGIHHTPDDVQLTGPASSH